MANQTAAPCISGRYDLDFSQALPGAGGGLEAFAARDRLDARASLMAVKLSRMAPGRSDIVTSLAPLDLPGLLLPRAHGGCVQPGRGPAGWLVCQAPPGGDLAGPYRWSESEIIQCVLRPAAAALVALAARRLTHRAIRLNNMFRAGPGRPVVLGCAWANPPAALQPVLYEPLGSAVCAPAARGNGLIADDVYALGVLLLVLCLGREPLAGLDDAAILDRKLTLGSHAALTDGERVPQAILDLTRGMLAEDPDHRPPPSLLLDPSEARGRRVAARPPRRAQRGLEMGGETVWNARAMARALGRHPDEAAQALRSNVVDRWLRHGFGDATLAIRLDDLVHQRNSEALADDPIADSILVMRAVVLLDPLAPLWWRGVALWPDALGPMLADGGYDAVVQDLIGHEIVGAWGLMAPDRNDSAMLQIEGRRLRSLLRQRGAASGLDRLRYVLNPLLPCASPLLEDGWVTEPADLLPQLEALAEHQRLPAAGAIDAAIAAFLVARMPHGTDGEIARLDSNDPLGAALAQWRVLALLQDPVRVTSLPALAAWFVDQCRPVTAVWPSQKRVAEMEAAVPALIAAGRLKPLLGLFDDSARDQQDEADLQEVRTRVQRLDSALQQLKDGKDVRRRQARRLGGQIAVGLGGAALAGMLVLLVA